MIITETEISALLVRLVRGLVFYSILSWCEVQDVNKSLDPHLDLDPILFIGITYTFIHLVHIDKLKPQSTKIFHFVILLFTLPGLHKNLSSYCDWQNNDKRATLRLALVANPHQLTHTLFLSILPSLSLKAFLYSIFRLPTR